MKPLQEEPNDRVISAETTSLGARLRFHIRHLSPAYFAIVMATGIVSIAAHIDGMHLIAMALLAINAVLYMILLLLTTLRIVCHRQYFVADIRDHRRSVGFFSAVAATCVLGSQSLIVAQQLKAGMLLWGFGIALWLVSTYSIFTVLIVKQNKPSLAAGISGTWLLAVVAAQSIAVLSARLAVHWGQPYRLEANFLALSMWMWGGMLYIWMISLIFYRYTFFRFLPGDLEAPYWINMGAMAISALGGATLVSNTPDAWFLHSLRPFLEGFTVFFWATGTWWIPMLVILFVWRHLYSHFPLHYNPLYWGAVFPLGMYAVCTAEMASAMDLQFLAHISHVFVWVSLLAWSLCFLGFIRRVSRNVRAPVSVAS